MNTREKVLKEALNCVNGEREKQYGNPEDNFQRIADFWGLYLTTLFEGTNVVIELDPKDVAVMMILFKIARSLGAEDKLDNYVDIIGYAACGAEIFEKDTKMAESRSCSKKASDNIKEFFAKMDEANDSYQYFMEKNFGKEAVAESRSCMDEDAINDAYQYFMKKNFGEDKPDDCGQFDACMTAYQHFMEKNFGEEADPYSYYHDELVYYASIKAKEKLISLDVEDLKKINRKFPRELADYLHDATEDCVINGKKLFDCYREIDELFAKYTNKDTNANNTKVNGALTKHNPYAYWEAYSKIAAYIIASSRETNISQFDIVERLITNGYAPTTMAGLLMSGKLSFDDATAIIGNAVNELKGKHKTFEEVADSCWKKKESK